MTTIYERDVRNVRPLKTNIVPVVKDVNEIYEIKLDSIEIKDMSRLISGLTYGFLTDTNRMFTFVNAETVKNLWKQKERLDYYFDPTNNLSRLYYTARNSIFPQDQKGSLRFRNRAGDKLFEVHESVGLFPLKGGIFFDIAGGPGAWSEVLLKGGNWMGYGTTLQIEGESKEKIWYDHLYKDKRWAALWGSDGTGNLYKLDNINHAAQTIKQGFKDGVTLAMSDGGIHLEKDEHLQELYNFRLIFGELLASIKTVKNGGYFCCKFFDTFSYLTASVIYLIGLMFDKVYVVKPRKSRIVNSERYVVGHRFIKLDNLISYLDKIFKEWTDTNAPISLVPLDLMLNDKSFVSTFSEQANDLAEKQTKALKQVMDLADTYK